MNKYKEFPKKVKINYKTYKVKITEDENILKGNIGTCSSHDDIIYVKPLESASETLNTLLHEVLHGIYYTSTLGRGNDNMDEEKIVNTMANGLCQVLMDNPVFTDCFKKYR